VEGLLNWLRSHGGMAHLEVGAVCDGCMRGTLATKDFKTGDVIARVPGHLVVEIGPRSQDVQMGSAQWAIEMARNASYAKAFAPFLDTLPTVGEVLSPELFTPAMLDALQSDELAKIVQERIDFTELTYDVHLTPNESAVGARQPAATILPNITLDEYKHLVAAVTTRMYGWPSRKHQDAPYVQLLPVFDMANCADPGMNEDSPTGSNAGVTYPKEDGTFEMTAKRPIKKGEEVTNNYGNDYLHRPDMTLLVYGFVPLRDPPIMSTCDLPTGFGDVLHPQLGYPQTPRHDPDYGNPAGNYTTSAELTRLAAIISAFPTTLEQDVELLKDEEDWKMANVLRWRVGRKRAVLGATALLANTLLESASAIADTITPLAKKHGTWPNNLNFGSKRPESAPLQEPPPLPDGSIHQEGPSHTSSDREL